MKSDFRLRRDSTSYEIRIKVVLEGIDTGGRCCGFRESKWLWEMVDCVAGVVGKLGCVATWSYF